MAVVYMHDCSLVLFLLILFVIDVLKPTDALLGSIRSSRYLQSKSTTLHHAVSCAVADEVRGWEPSFYATFMQEYWQRKPVLIRGAFPRLMQGLQLSPLDRCLAQLATDEDVETRIIRNRRGIWEKTYGPYNERDILRSPKTNWSILLQEMDRHVPRVADLWDAGFDFIPAWRRDDVMMSYSMPGGSIGAHVDNYDVFLIQGSGRRQWSIEHNFLSESEEQRREIPDEATRLLRDFRGDQCWELEEGDMLYLPPRLPHQGVTVGTAPSVTISMGFRAPDYKMLVSAMWDNICQTTLRERQSLFADASFATEYLQRGGEVGPAARQEFKAGISSKILDFVGDNDVFNRWLGRHLTSPLRYHRRKPRPFFLEHASNKEATEDFGRSEVSEYEQGEEDEEEEEEEEEDDGQLPLYLREQFRLASERIFPSAGDVVDVLINTDEIKLRKCEGVRIAFIGDVLFVDGEEVTSSRVLSATLSNRVVVTGDDVRKAMLADDDDGSCRRVLMSLLERGCFYPVE